MDRRKRNEKIINIARERETRKEKRAFQKNVKRAAPRRRTRVFAYRKFYAAVALVMLVMACVYAVRITALETDEALASAELEAALDKKARLENELKYIDDPTYIELQARTRLRMVKPGEIYYVLPESDEAEEAGPGGAEEIESDEAGEIESGGEDAGGADDGAGLE